MEDGASEAFIVELKQFDQVRDIMHEGFYFGGAQLLSDETCVHARSFVAKGSSRSLPMVLIDANMLRGSLMTRALLSKAGEGQRCCTPLLPALPMIRYRSTI
ncbi:MAG: hypothetical protein WB609_12870 [Candidatus Cybelea sp.]